MPLTWVLGPAFKHLSPASCESLRRLCYRCFSATQRLHRLATHSAKAQMWFAKAPGPRLNAGHPSYGGWLTSQAFRQRIFSPCCLLNQLAPSLRPPVLRQSANHLLMRTRRIVTSGANWHAFNSNPGVRFCLMCRVLSKHAGVPNWAVKGTKTASCFYPPRFALRCPLPGC